MPLAVILVSLNNSSLNRISFTTYFFERYIINKLSILLGVIFVVDRILNDQLFLISLAPTCVSLKAEFCLTSDQNEPTNTSTGIVPPNPSEVDVVWYICIFLSYCLLSIHVVLFRYNPR